MRILSALILAAIIIAPVLVSGCVCCGEDESMLGPPPDTRLTGEPGKAYYPIYFLKAGSGGYDYEEITSYEETATARMYVVEDTYDHGYDRLSEVLTLTGYGELDLALPGIWPGVVVRNETETKKVLFHRANVGYVGLVETANVTRG